MTFQLDHWKNPRKTIACLYAENDLAYATHGACAVAEILQAFDVKPSEAMQASILDFGSGTARISRILARHFHKVIAFDPVPECMMAAQREQSLCYPMKFPALELVESWDQVPNCIDFACAVNVFEHLDLIAQERAMEQISSALKPGGRAALWLSKTRNSALLKQCPMRRIFEGPHIGVYVWTKG
jgi:SAM-dependent methyltransferase